MLPAQNNVKISRLSSVYIALHCFRVKIIIFFELRPRRTIIFCIYLEWHIYVFGVYFRDLNLCNSIQKINKCFMLWCVPQLLYSNFTWIEWKIWPFQGITFIFQKIVNHKKNSVKVWLLWTNELAKVFDLWWILKVTVSILY